MELPKVVTCILCEDVRIEEGHKLSLMGVFGYLPHAIIIVSNLNFVMKLSFVLMLEGGSGKAAIKFKVKEPNQKDFNPNIQPQTQMEMTFEKGGRANLAWTIPNFVPRATGKYEVVVFANDQILYETDFEISKL